MQPLQHDFLVAPFLRGPQTIPMLSLSAYSPFHSLALLAVNLYNVLPPKPSSGPLSTIAVYYWIWMLNFEVLFVYLKFKQKKARGGRLSYRKIFID